MLRRAACCVLLWLAGCSSHPATPSSKPYVVSVRDIPYQGMHDFVGRTIELDDEVGTEQTLARLVVAHELGHALHVPHMPCPSIMCGRHGKGEALIGLSKAEVRAARPVWETRVRCDPSCNQTIREAVDWAILQWNVKIGGTAFVRDTP